MSGEQILWLSQDDPPDVFPPVTDALREPDGLLAAGGDLGSPRLLSAYCRGIFPWYEQGQPVLWWSPDPRCVFHRGDLHVSRRLRRDVRRSALQISCNTRFAEVIKGCAAPRRYGDGTWITPDMLAAYEQLHTEGWAHSIEIYDGEELVGGLYGIAIGRAFFGESMFSERANASKYALLLLDRLLAEKRLGLIDCQVSSAHLLSMGAVLMPRSEFTRELDRLCEPAARFTELPTTRLPVAELL